MKDGYSFHADEESLQKTYQEMYTAYSNMLRRSGLAFRAVEADSGAIGGSGSTEFMVLADAGEDEVLYTEDGKYAANVEKAVSLPAEVEISPFTTFEKRETPGIDTIEKLCNFLKCSPTKIVKNVLYQTVYDNGFTVLVLINIRGDQEINEVKLQNELTKLAPQFGAKTILTLTVPNVETQATWQAKSLPLGYIAPDISDDYNIAVNKQVNSQFVRLVDKTAVELKNFVTGANTSGFHVVGANWGEQFKLPIITVDIRKAKLGDRSLHNQNQSLQTARGIEAGHIFQLGTKYSQAMGATYTNEQGEEKPLVMGCYGVGVSRLAQSAVEQSYDKDGIIWPIAIAPYHAIITIPNIKDVQQIEVAEKLYTELNKVGVETLLDDRDERAGVKFKDADLIGIPFRIVTGRAITNGKVEIVKRATRESQEIAIEEVINTLQQWINEAIAG